MFKKHDAKYLVNLMYCYYIVMLHKLYDKSSNRDRLSLIQGQLRVMRRSYGR